MAPAQAWVYVEVSDILRGCQGCCSPQFSPPQELDLLTGDPKWLDVIERDLHRQFPFHEMFVSRGGHGYVELLCVQPSAAMDGVGTVNPSSWSHTHVPSVLPIPPTFPILPQSQSIH